MGEILNWSLMASGVILLAFILRAMLKDKMKKTWLNALWLIVLVRLLLPILPSSSMSLFNLWEGIISSHIINNQNTVVNTEMGKVPMNFIDDEAALPQSDVGSQEKFIVRADNDAINGINKQQILLGLWFIGMLVVLSYFSVGYYQMKKRINQMEVVEEKEILALIAKLKELLHIKTEVKLVKGDYPFVFGLIRPTICISNTFTRQDVEMMLLHELTHLRYKDNVLTYLHIFACALHWFNPFVWIAIKLMKSDMELACDERVLKIGTNKKQYASTLLNITLMPQREIYWVQGMKENMKQIKDRLSLIATFKEPKLSVTILGVIVLIIGGMVCLTTAQQPKTSTERKIDTGKGASKQASKLENNLTKEQGWRNENSKNIVVFGLDEKQPLTDTIMVVNLDKKQDTLKVISIPKDTKIEWDEEEKQVVGVPAPNVTKINEMYAFAKGENTDKLAVKEIEKLLNIQVDDVIIVDLKTVEKTIDALGGVNIELMQDMRYSDKAAGLNINLKKGQQQLDGAQTLQAIRYRRYRDGDLGRINVQQQILKALLNKVLEENNPSQLVEVASQLFNGIKTNISLEDLPSYIQVLLAVKQNQMSFYTLPGEGGYEEGRSYFLPNLEESTALFH